MWHWVARGNTQQISYIPQTEQHLPFVLMLLHLGNVNYPLEPTGGIGSISPPHAWVPLTDNEVILYRYQKGGRNHERNRRIPV